MLNISPLMLAQIALNRPELLAAQMAALGRMPPKQFASSGNGPADVGGQPVVPQPAAPQPGLSPMPAPTPIPPAAASTPAPAGPMPPLPPQPTYTPPAGTTPVDPMASIGAAMAGVAPSLAGGGEPQRVPLAPAPFIPSALNPQTLAILQQMMQQPAAAPSLGQLMAGR